MSNTRIEYLYRDADNYKTWNTCVIAGTLSAEQKAAILDARHEGEWFIPSLVGLAEKRFDKWDMQSDHIWFELWDDAFSETLDAPTVNITVSELTDAFSRCKNRWEEVFLYTQNKAPSASDYIQQQKDEIQECNQAIDSLCRTMRAMGVPDNEWGKNVMVKEYLRHIEKAERNIAQYKTTENSLDKQIQSASARASKGVTGHEKEAELER